MRLTRRGQRIVVAVALVGVVTAGIAVAQALSHRSLIVQPGDPCGTPPPLRTYHGVRLQPSAMKAFKRAERLADRSIPVIESYRSCSRQALACRSICGNGGGCPGRCASPGSSYHQLGAAIDVSRETLDDPGIVAALEKAGWCQSVP